MKPLKPVMAAILAASSFPFPLSATAGDFRGELPYNPASPSTPVADPAPLPGAAPLSDGAARAKAIARDKEFVQRLVSFVDAKPEVRKDIGARLAKFILNRETGHQYLTTGLLDDKVNIPGAVKVAQDWPEVNKGNPTKVAELYYLLGATAGKAPAWAPAGYEDEFKPNAIWSVRLAAALSDANWDTTKQVAQSGAADGTTALLNFAAEAAHKILDDARTKGEVHASVDANATTAVNPPTTKAASNALDTTGSGYGFDDLYVKGARAENVYSPNDDGYRRISVKIYTTRDENNNLVNKIGLVDITKPDPGTPSPVQWVDASKVGDQDITFRDGGRPYTVTIDQTGAITVKRKGAGDGGGQIKTSKFDLSKRRDEQIASGGTVSIGSPPLNYYVLPQGGPKGSWLFFPKSQIDQMRADQAAGRNPDLNAHPDLMGDVVTGSSDGPIPIKGKPDLGSLPNGDPYHLEFDMVTRMYKVVAGKGDTGTPPPAGSTTTATTTTGDGGTTVAPPVTMPAPKNLQEAIQYWTADKPNNKDQVWVEDDGNKGFDQATLARVRILSNQRATDNMTHFKVLFDPALGVKDNAFEFQAMNGSVRLLHVFGAKSYVALEYGTGTQYYDLENFANYVQHVYDPSLSYHQAGSYAVSNGQMQDVTSADIVADVLTRYMKVKDTDDSFKTIFSRIVKHSGGKGFVINGDMKTLYMGVGEVGRTIWPNDIASGDANTNEKMTGLRGPGTAVDVTGGGPGEFKKSFDVSPGHTATLVKTENHAALYSSTEEETAGGQTKTVKVWSIMLEYKKNGLDSRSKALPVFGTGKDRYNLPATLHMAGLPGVDLPDSTQLMMEHGSNQENGAIAAYRYVLPDAQGGQNARDKKGNCAGVVLWWGGVTKEKAQSACESDSRIK
jgi:hypothetical protein